LLPVHSILVVGLQYSQSAGIVARTHQTVSNLFVLQARISQAVARIADRTASQHLRGHVTSSVIWPFDSPYVISYWWSFGTKPLSL